jgi:[ribosomal protein S5]-alanine N-acetyltransferase
MCTPPVGRHEPPVPCRRACPYWDNGLVSPLQQLSGRLISLRAFTPAYGEALASLADDEAMFEFMKFRIDASWLARVLPHLLREPEPAAPRRIFSLAAVAEERFIGLVALGPVTNERQAEFGWYLRSDAWGRGYATEATTMLLTFGFHDLGLVRLFATADPENTASIRVLTKSGLRNEGLTDPVETWRGVRPRLLFTIDRTYWKSS